ncbi:MAG TPA: hypothetical protein VGK87_11180 [Anaerolineae bacterium]|jgi:hypothetical protein
MNKLITLFIRALAACAVVICLTGGVQAQTGGGYDLTWNALPAGVSTSTGGGYELTGDVGQSGAGAAAGGGFSLQGGFLVTSPFRAYLPVVLR